MVYYYFGIKKTIVLGSMKKIGLITTLVILLISCKTKKSWDKRFGALNRTSVSEEKIEDYKLFLEDYFMDCNISETHDIQFSKKLKNLTSENGYKSCRGMTSDIGNLNSIFLEELRGDGHSYIVYRYKAQFEARPYFSEIRLVERFDGELISLILRKKWYETMDNITSK
ncbi:hypothetical protein C8D94_103199 [Marinirhabdus gelatinilytica]|uniref:DUF4019 domain-containing protein n=2 Tax=Marinirhabdus gelatinilytica TaxID=1703343 RepID=A0A370QAH4_9FLAO|nr:hypothetical protein C8D94_103199 [Marinirhabdus gelatinilytica]